VRLNCGSSCLVNKERVWVKVGQGSQEGPQ
jgi:hypothetical protein